MNVWAAYLVGGQTVVTVELEDADLTALAAGERTFARYASDDIVVHLYVKEES